MTFCISSIINYVLRDLQTYVFERIIAIYEVLSR